MQTERSERRAAPRHRIALPVMLDDAWGSTRDVALPITLDDARGSTRDVSASGVFFTLRGRSIRLLEPRELIRFRLTLKHVDPSGPLHIGCDGRVVRVEGGPDGIGVAVSIDSYHFGQGESAVTEESNKRR